MPIRPHTKMRRDAAAAQAGVSLIEVLVALVVLSLGVLSVVTLQLISKRNTSDAGQAVVVASLANDLIERIRANSSSNGLAAYLNAAANGIGSGRQGSEPSPNCQSASSGCTPAQLAAYDVWEWEQIADGRLEQVIDADGNAESVGGLKLATACLTASPPGGVSALYTLTIAWRGNTELPDNADLTCGRGAVIGGVKAYGDNNEYRRTYQRSVWIQQS